MTLHSIPAIRPATSSDAPSLAKLIDMAGEGIPRWLWSQSCNDGQDPLEIGEDRARRTQGGFSFRNALIAQGQTRLLGMVLSYPIEEAPDADIDNLPAPIAPFVELEAQAVGTWYINALAVFLSGRGAGVGSALMHAAEEAARQAGYSKMSVQVFRRTLALCASMKDLDFTRLRGLLFASTRASPITMRM